ncbi:ABC transporter permease [Ruminiclostridium cellobioparum]|uniref:ABC-type polysaccharide transport system, permease component n=1 Tax=Ruminiclostridium cellobioparum subsp. termitidis CT1112 TaxID=1195236 RepID=S0FMH9_RUMCE|nr:ABC transporter permease subunit [Ruminiclostridium cellobioparum]EMS73117.1 ABC-type polysaccharide transport system, permease component [Ruminiclostridium cellobioparum subsp. termitidis CT1112]
MKTNPAQLSVQNSIQSNRKSELKSKIKRQRAVLLLLIPGVVWYLIFKYAPMAGAIAAFTDYGTRADISFTGLENFKQLFGSPGFWGAFRNTLLISLYNLLFYFPLPIILALLMNEIVITRIKRAIQFVVYIPHFFSWVVIGAIFSMVLSPSNGFVNQIISAFGLEPQYFMVDPKWFRSVLVSSYIWRDVGYGTIIYIATISSIDEQLYDAATVDGSGYWGKLLYVTLPSLKSTIATVLLLTVARILLIFEQVLVMYVPPVYSVSEVLTTYSFTEGLLNGNIGYATAVSLFTAVISAILVIGCNKASKKFLDESIL